MKKELQNAREDYQQGKLVEADLDQDPVEMFKLWLKQYQQVTQTEFNAMTLSTVTPDNKAASRILLLKGIVDGGFDFYTNYKSDKARDIENNPSVSLCFYWPEMERQVRIQGKAEKISAAESDEYFSSRPYGSRIGAWTSPQSQPISREELEQRQKDFEEKFPNEVPRPEHWGGFRVKPEKVEFWQGRSSRLHDRFVYTRNGDLWDSYRIAP